VVLQYEEEERKRRRKTVISRNLLLHAIGAVYFLHATFPYPLPHNKSDNRGRGAPIQQLHSHSPVTPTFGHNTQPHIQSNPLPNPHNTHTHAHVAKKDQSTIMIERFGAGSAQPHALPDSASSPPRSRTERAQPEGSGSRARIHLAAGNRSNWPTGALTRPRCLFSFPSTFGCASEGFQERFFGISERGPALGSWKEKDCLLFPLSSLECGDWLGG